MAFPGFNNSKKRGTISRGDFDRDGVSNRKDCEPLNFRKQDIDEYNYGKKAPKCPKCGAQTVLQDDSFDFGAGHHGSGGTQTIIYPACPKCGWEEE